MAQRFTPRDRRHYTRGVEADLDSVDAPVAALGSGDSLRSPLGWSDPLPSLVSAFAAALAAADVRDARRMVAAAADQGIAPGRMYVAVVRPALAAFQRPGPHARERLAAGLGEAVLADLVARLPVGDRRGSGRAAVLSCRDRGIEAVDGSVAMDFLACDGWSVDRSGPRGRMPAIARDGGIELAVAVTAGPEDALRLAPVCTDLRRLADPPVIILCDFSGRFDQRAASSALGADAVAHDPQELVRCAAERLPDPGQRHWGVRLSRKGTDLVLAPTGRLDATSMSRLVDVAATRSGTFARLVVDLRDLAEIAPAGALALGHWPDRLPGVEVRVLADAGVLVRLRSTGVQLPPELIDSP